MTAETARRSYVPGQFLTGVHRLLLKCVQVIKLTDDEAPELTCPA